MDEFVELTCIRGEFDGFVSLNGNNDGADELIVSAGVDFFNVAFGEKAIDFFIYLGLDANGDPASFLMLSLEGAFEFCANHVVFHSARSREEVRIFVNQIMIVFTFGNYVVDWVKATIG